MQAAEKKRPKEEKEIANRLRPFARLQTAEDYEVFVTDIICDLVTTIIWRAQLTLSRFILR
jgi:transcriptional adapter 2-alpha